MTVRRLRKAQRGPWCSYCEPKTSRAIYRGCHFTLFACFDHLEHLQAADDEEARRDGYETEAERSIPWV